MHLKDAIVVLGCRVSDSGAVAGALLRRCERAATAHREGLAPRVVACGGKRWAGGVEAVAMRAKLRELGVPDAVIHGEELSESTWGNVVYGGRLLRTLGAHRLAVVTCDFHQLRALALFRSAGFDCVGLACKTPPTSLSRVLLRSGREHVLSLIQPGVQCGD